MILPTQNLGSDEMPVSDWSILEKSGIQFFFGAISDKVVRDGEAPISARRCMRLVKTMLPYAILRSTKLPDEKIIFKSTAEGDQSVTRASGIPVNLDKDKNLYYVPVTHGAFANEPDMFKASRKYWLPALWNCSQG